MGNTVRKRVGSLQGIEVGDVSVDYRSGKCQPSGQNPGFTVSCGREKRMNFTGYYFQR